MYKVLISQQDKEQMRLIRESLLSGFDEVFIFCTSSGEETIDIVSKEHPDLVFQGIELNDVSGIDVATEIMKISPESHIVFLSCYDHFEFARTAMHLGVEDYLLMPVTEQDIIEVTSDVLRKVDNYRAVKYTESKNREFMQDSKDLLGYGFIYSILFSDSLRKNISEYKRTLGITDRGFWYNIEVCNESYKPAVKDDELINVVSETLRKNVKYIIGPKIGERLLVYIPVMDDDVRFEDEKFIISLAKIVKREIESAFILKTNIGIGSIRNLDELHISYEESIKSLRDNKDVVKYVGSENNDLYVKATVIEKRLFESIELDKDDVRKLFVLLLQQYEELPLKDRKSKVLELFAIINHKISSMGAEEWETCDSMRMYQEIMDLSEDNIDIYSMNKFEYLLKALRRRNTQNLSPTVKKAMHYMSEHFNENITLNDISNLVGVSVQYFSKIFKEEVGCNYVDWLNSLRINRAKELMESTQMTIKEVGFQVGYNDPNYFSRIFKRYEGVAPTEYVNRKEVS